MQMASLFWEHRYGIAMMLIGAGLSIILGKLLGMLCIGIGIGIVIGEHLAPLTAKKTPAETPVAEPSKESAKLKEDLQNVSAYSAALNRELATVNEKLKESEAKRQMPRPYLEVQDSAEARSQHTPFVFTNRGGDVAHNVQIQPLKVHYHDVTFQQIPTIAVNESKHTLPTVSGQGHLLEHDIFHVMGEEWDAAGKGLSQIRGEHSIHLVISYTDCFGKQFESTAEVVYFPINAINHKQWEQHIGNEPEWLKRDFKIVEVRNTTFNQVVNKNEGS